MKIKIKKLNDNAKLPTRGSDYAAGWDLYALSEDGSKICIDANDTVMIHTGVAVEIPEGYFGAIYARSGLATKRGLAPANCVGIIDSDYRGEVVVALHNHASSVCVTNQYIRPGYFEQEVVPDSSADESIEDGERIAQLIIQKFEDIELEEVDELSDTDRGEGGFGSTGK